MKVFVTGASGFIGSHLVAALMRRGHHVTACVRDGPKADALAVTDRVIIDEIGPDTEWGNALAGQDAVVNLAARVHVMEDHDPDPLASFRQINVHGFKKLVEAAVIADVGRIISLSSVKAIGEDSATQIPIDDDTPENPVDPYGISKCEADEMLRSIAEKSVTGWTVLRPPLVYGPNVRGNFLTLLGACAHRKPLPVGGIKNLRSMIYVGNLVDALCVSIESETPLNDVFLVDDNAPIATPDLVRSISDALGVSPRIINVPPELLRICLIALGKRSVADRLMGSFVLDSRRFRRLAGWTPPYKMIQGLADTASWYASHYDR